jgi:hypothetical protein
MISVVVVLPGDGAVPPMTSVSTGASLFAAGAVDVAGAVGTGVAVAVALPEVAGAGAALDVADGEDVGPAQAGEVATAGNEARERTNAAIHAVLFLVLFTMCLS